VDSTSRQAEVLVGAGALALPGAVLALRQTAGRGRGQHVWWSDGGALTVTFVYPVEPGRPPGQLPLRAGLTLHRAVGRYIPPDRLRVKWPNDLLADGKKIAGILCQRVTGDSASSAADLVGIGINITTDFAAAPEEVRIRAAAISAFTAQPPALTELFIDLARELGRMWDDNDWTNAFNRVHILHAQPVAIDTGQRIVRGTCRGVDPEGRLLVEDGKKARAIHYGEVIEWPGKRG
jgi:BirA family transcriptional regulator, biotin operon repressor / biotin---[acetyl-CoA-carboxylase] ligase